MHESYDISMIHICTLYASNQIITTVLKGETQSSSLLNHSFNLISVSYDTDDQTDLATFTSLCDLKIKG